MNLSTMREIDFQWELSLLKSICLDIQKIIGHASFAHCTLHSVQVLVGCVALGMRNKWTIFGLTENVVRCMWFVCVCSFCIFDTRIPRGPRNSFVVSHFFTSNLHRFSIWTYNSICRFSKIWRFQFVVVHLTINYFAFWTNDS